MKLQDVKVWPAGKVLDAIQLVITGAFPQGFHQLARRLNVAEYFEKPLDVEAFIKRLTETIQKRRRIAS
jgi:hypothetical protein